MELVKNPIEQYKQLPPLTKEHEEVIDVIVPDINPDVFDIVYVWGQCSVKEKRASQGNVLVTGDIIIKAFYKAEEDKLYSVSGQIPFSYTHELAGADAGDLVNAKLEVNNATAVALNPRKLTLKADVSLDVKLYQPHTIEVTESAFGQPNEGVQVKTSEESWNYLGLACEKKLAFNEEIRLLPGDISPSDSILRNDLTWQIDDSKVMTNKLLLKGHAIVSIITMPQKGSTVNKSTYKLPFSQVIEHDELNSDDSAQIDFQTLQFDTSLVTKGEEELYLYCNIFGSICVTAEKQANLTLLKDIYSTAYDLNFETEEIAGEIGEDLLVKEGFEAIIELKTPGMRILDYCCTSKAKCTPDAIKACVYFNILYENRDNEVLSATRRIEVDIPKGDFSLGCHIKTAIEDESVTVDSAGAICIEGKIALTGKENCKQPRCHIKQCEVLENKPIERQRDASLVLRAAQNGESLWGIAKEYKTSLDAVMSANRLDDGEPLPKGKLIIIPFVQ